jgi:hypothetical protein
MDAGSITVIIPFYNRRHTILTALASVESQTVLPEQLIVVDDGSTDGGGALVAEWMAKGSRLRHCRLERQGNRGAAAARNHGLSIAKPSKYVAFLDSDDIWPADFLERTQAALSTFAGAIAASCDRRFVYSDGRPNRTDDCAPLGCRPSLWMVEFGAGIASATLFRRDAIERRGGFPALATGEDAALFLPLSLDGRWLHVPGEPVCFQSGLAQRLGDEGHLSEKFSDGHESWAQLFEQFFTRGEGRALLSDPECGRQLAKAWHRAGRYLFRRCAPHQALKCFGKSWAWNPWRAKCYVWMLRSLLAMPARKAVSMSSPSGFPHSDCEQHKGRRFRYRQAN